MIKRLAVLIAFTSILTFIYGGCDNNNDRTTAVLDAMESIGVPGRIEMDGHRSTARSGRELVSHTYTVFDMETGEIVYGPVVLNELLDQAFIRTYILPEDAPMNADGVITVSGDYLVTLDVEDDQGGMDSAEQVVSVDAQVLPGSSESCKPTCSKSSQTPGQITCPLETGCYMIDVVDDLLDPVETISSDVNDSTTMWIRACGAGGGRGTDNDLGGDGGDPGEGGFAQTITTVSEYQSVFGTTNLFYYLGVQGEHDDSGGSGGASTIIASKEPTTDDPWALSDIVVLGGGGGGGGEGTAFEVGAYDGGNGGAGAFAYSKTVGQSDTGIGGRGGHGTGGNGGGGTMCTQKVACGGPASKVSDNNPGLSGNQGFGGRSGGSGSISSEELGGDNPKGWVNATPDIGGDGAGGKGNTCETCDGGGGGGGFGGGGAGEVNRPITSCGGGAGGGSHASASTKTDSKAPDKNICGTWTNGDAVITFDLDPGD